MSLFEKANITNNNPKNTKKSILLANKIDLFIIIILAVLVISPLIAHLFNKLEAGAKQINLYISPQSEELFGKEIMEKLMLEFEEQHPEVRIRFATGSAEPDILIFDEGDFSALVAADSFVELNSFTNYDSGTKQLAVPLVSFMDLFFYNIDILSAAGFGSPPKTRDQFISYARTISGGDFGASASAISLNSNDRQALSRDIFSWIWAGGGNFWAGENGPSLNTRTIISDLTFLGALNRDGLLAPDIFETTGSQRVDQFAQGKVAMMIASARVIPSLRKRMGDGAFGITTIPDSGAGGKYNVGLSAIYAGINANCTQLEAAWSFLVFLAEKSSLINAELKAIPGVVSDIIPGDYINDDTFYSKAWDIFESALIAEGFTGKPGAMEYKTAVLEELEIFFETNRTAQETVNVIQRRWDEVWETTNQ